MSKLESKRLGDILNFKRGYDLPLSEREPGPYPIISSSGISGFHSKFKARGEGLVTGRYGTLGKMYYMNEEYWPHNTALYVTDFKGNYPKYVYFLMKCLGNIKTSDKSAVPGVNRNELHEMKVPYINGRPQKRIADLLYDLENKIDLNNRINAELESLARTIYDYWFLQFDFPGADGRPYRSSGGAMRFDEELGREVPDGWFPGKINDLGQVVGGSTPSRKQVENFTENGTAWITPKDLSLNKGKVFIRKGEIDVSDIGLADARLKVIPAGSVLMSSRAPVGYLAIATNELTTNQGFKSIVPGGDYSSEFIYFTLLAQWSVADWVKK
jgi:type I restriction enzyme S subunit